MSTFLENTPTMTTDLSFITPEFIQNKLLEKLPKILGTDSNEKAYKSIKSLWDFIYKKKKTTKVVSNEENKDDQTWYNTANNYWDDAKNCPISDGKLIFNLFLISFLYFLHLFFPFRWCFRRIW